MPTTEVGMRARWIGGAVVAVLAGTAFADSWMPFTGQRGVAAGKQYYVTVEPSRKFRFVKAGADLPAPVTIDRLKRGQSKQLLHPRDGDTLLAEGTLPQLPMELAVSPSGQGFAAVDLYARLGGGKSVVWVDAAGAVQAQVTLRDLYDEATRNKFQRTTSSTWWLNQAWIDDGLEAVVLLDTLGGIRVVSWKDGAVRAGGEAELLTACFAAPPAAQRAVLSQIDATSSPPLRDAARTLLNDAVAPIEVRVDAAVALRRAGDDAGRALILATAKQGPKEARQTAIAHLSLFLGAKAAPQLRALMRGTAGDHWWPAIEAFKKMGEPAVPTLLEMLAEQGQAPDYRGGAAHALAEIQSPSAIDGLLQAVATADGYTANAAANAVIGYAPADTLQTRFIAILASGKSTQDSRIAMWLDRHPATQAVPALIGAYARAHAADAGSFDSRFIHRALVKCHGADLGADPAAWRAWLTQREKQR